MEKPILYGKIYGVIIVLFNCSQHAHDQSMYNFASWHRAGRIMDDVAMVGPSIDPGGTTSAADVSIPAWYQSTK